MKMAGTGEFKFTMQAPESSQEGRVETPDSDLTMRFVVVMRRLLNSSDRPFIKTVWATMQNESGDELSEQLKAGIEKGIAALTRGWARIEVDGEILTAKRVYEIMCTSQNLT